MRRTRSTSAPVLTRANQRAGTLIEAMLHEMQRGLRNPKKLESEEWARLFGNRQSMVANLQKLVQSLAALSEPRGKQSTIAVENREAVAMDPQEMRILSAWLKDEGAPREA